jgi:hypothetical protein
MTFPSAVAVTGAWVWDGFDAEFVIKARCPLGGKILNIADVKEKLPS